MRSLPLLAGTLLLSSLLAFAEDPGQAAKISWWTIDGRFNETAIFQSLADDYMASHPGLKIEITALESDAFKTELSAAMEAGAPPDIFHSWGGGPLAEYAQAGLLRDISGEIKGTAWGDSMAPGVFCPYGAGGKVYAVPYDMGAITFWYNKELLKKVGYDSFPADYEDFLALIKKLRAAGIAPIALGGNDKWPALHLWSYLALRLGGAELFRGLLDGSDPKGFKDPVFIKASRMVAELSKAGAFQKGFLGATYPDAAAIMGNGRAAMELMGQWGPNVERDSSDDKKGLGEELAAAPFPAIKGGKGARFDIIGGGNGMALGRDASVEALDFLKYLTGKESQMRIAMAIGAIPTAKGAEAGVADSRMRMVKAIVDRCAYYQLYLDQLLPPTAAGAVNDAVQALLAGTVTPEEACAYMQAAYLESAR